MIWSTVATGDDIQDKDRPNGYILAGTERNFWGVTGDDNTPLSAGDDMQSASFWRKLQLAFTNTNEDDGGVSAVAYPSEYPSLPFLSGYWVVPTDFTGKVLTDIDYAGGNGTSLSSYVITWQYIKDHALSSKSWTRKYPREFLDDAATEYAWTDTTRDPNAFANGDKARNQTDGRVYLRSGGAWVIQSRDTMPDVVTSEGLMAPGEIKGDTGHFIETFSDYLSKEMMNDLRNATNLLESAVIAFTDLFVGGDAGWIDAEGKDTGQLGSPTGPLAGGGYGASMCGSAACFPSWAAAQSATVTLYNASATNFFYYNGPGYQSSGAYSLATDLYGAGITRTKARAYVISWNTTTATHVECYTIGYPNPATGTFDNSGDNVANGTYTIFDTVSVAAGSAATKTDYLGDTTVPTWCADPSTSPDEQHLGYVAGNGSGLGGLSASNVMRIFNMRVTGGLQYHA